MLQVSQISPHSLSLSWAELWPRLPRFLWWWWLCQWQWWWWKITPLPTITLRSYCWLSQSKFKGPIAKLWILIQCMIGNKDESSFKYCFDVLNKLLPSSGSVWSAHMWLPTVSKTSETKFALRRNLLGLDHVAPPIPLTSEKFFQKLFFVCNTNQSGWWRKVWNWNLWTFFNVLTLLHQQIVC